MKARIFIIVSLLIISLVMPPVSHGFGFLRYFFDAVSNQLGLDRGPVPKVLWKTSRDPYCQKDAFGGRQHPDSHRIHIQAEGW